MQIPHATANSAYMTYMTSPAPLSARERMMPPASMTWNASLKTTGETARATS